MTSQWGLGFRVYMFILVLGLRALGLNVLGCRVSSVGGLGFGASGVKVLSL